MRDFPPRVVVLPVKSHWSDFTRPLVDRLLAHEHPDRVLILDNGSTDETANAALFHVDPRVRYVYRPLWNLYAMWNDGVRAALVDYPDGPVDVLVANNDIALPAGALDALSTVLRSDSALVAVCPNPDLSSEAGVAGLGYREVEGSYRVGGMIGWCFMLKAEDARIRSFDEGYEWWYGDDDAFLTWTRAGGVLARVLGVGCDHVGEGTARDGSNDWVHEAKVRDRARFEAKWGHGTGR